jgi:hypothetical protein
LKACHVAHRGVTSLAARQVPATGLIVPPCGEQQGRGPSAGRTCSELNALLRSNAGDVDEIVPIRYRTARRMDAPPASERQPARLLANPPVTSCLQAVRRLRRPGIDVRWSLRVAAANATSFGLSETPAAGSSQRAASSVGASDPKSRRGGRELGRQRCASHGACPFLSCSAQRVDAPPAAAGRLERGGCAGHQWAGDAHDRMS